METLAVGLWLLAIAGCGSGEQDLDDARFADCERSSLHDMHLDGLDDWLEIRVYDEQGNHQATTWDVFLDDDLVDGSDIYTYDDEQRPVRAERFAYAPTLYDEVQTFTYHDDTEYVARWEVDEGSNGHLEQISVTELVEVVMDEDGEHPVQVTLDWLQYEGEDDPEPWAFTQVLHYDEEGHLVRTTQEDLGPVGWVLESTWWEGLHLSTLTYQSDERVEPPSALVRELYRTWDEEGFELTTEEWSTTQPSLARHTWSCPGGAR